MMEDTELLCRYLDDRSEKAFTELVSRHVNLVYLAALRRVGGDRHLAADVTQRVFADLARKAPALKTRAGLAGWLYTSTRFAAAQAVRTERRRQAYEQEAHTMTELHAAPEPGWDQLRPIIDEVMDELSEHDREAVLLRFFEDLSAAEIGAKFSLSPDAVRMRINRALDRLRELLAKRGVASTSVALSAILASQSGEAAPSGLVARIVAVAFRPAVATFRMRKILIGLAIAAIGAGFVVYEANRIYLLAAFSTPGNFVGVLRQNPTDPAGSSSQVTVQSGLGQPSPSSVGTKHGMSLSQYLVKMNTDPQFRASAIALARSRLGLQYGPLFKNLNLSADRLEQFKDLLMEKELLANDIYETLSHEPVHGVAYRVLFSRLDVTLSRDVDDKIQAFLTPPEYAQFVDYSEDLWQWMTVNEVTRVLQPAGTPLTDKQANLLVVLLRGESPKSTNIHHLDVPYGTGYITHPAAANSQITAPIFEKARGILSPSQMDALRQVQERLSAVAPDPSYNGGYHITTLVP